MKKIIFLFLFLFGSLLSYSQLDMTVGTCSYAVDTRNNSDIGFGFGFNFKHLHWDISNNVFNKRDLSNYSSTSVTRLNYGVTNIGYNIYFKNNYVFTPLVGYGWTNTEHMALVNFHGNNPTNTYYMDSTVPVPNIGFIITKYWRNIGMGIGFGTFEFFKFNINIKLIK